MSLFITFEGVEGCGKSTQAKTLYRRLLKESLYAVLTYEPGGTPIGDKLGEWLKKAGHEVTPQTELLLFNAARALSVAEVIKPNLEKRRVVISDRYTDSTTVYQGYGRGLDLNLVKIMNHTATGGLKPELTILLDIPVDTGLARKEEHDRFEQEEIAFHERVREGYLTLARAEPERWLVIDASQSQEATAEIIWQRVSELIASKVTLSDKSSGG